MLKRIIWIVIIILMVVLSFLLGAMVNAHSGGTDINRCHECRTDCIERGYEYGVAHCHVSHETSYELDNIPPTKDFPVIDNNSYELWKIIGASLGIGAIVLIWAYGYKRR